MAEERLLGDGSVRIGLFEFMKRLQPTAETAFITIGLRNTTVVDYTTDLNAIVAGINGLSLNPPPQLEPDRGHPRHRQGHRARSSGASGDRRRRGVRRAGGRRVFERSAQSAAPERRDDARRVDRRPIRPLRAVGSLADESNREQVLGDGAKQSGGRRVEVTADVNVPKALQQIAGDLSAQYVIQYALPDGVKPDRRLNVSLKRRGVSVRAPSLVPDR